MAKIFKELSKETVIILDHSGIFLELTSIIENFQITVKLAHTREEALTLIDDHRPFCLILPIVTDTNGFLEVWKHFKSRVLDGSILFLNKNSKNSDPLCLKPDGILDFPIEKSQNVKILESVFELRSQKILTENSEMDEITSLFVEEASELFKDLPNLILGLESENKETSTIDVVFRKVHSVKGAAGAIPLAEVLAHFTHIFESSLSLIRASILNPDEGCIDLFLTSADLCIELIDGLSQRVHPSEELKGRVEVCETLLQDLINSTNAKKDQPIEEAHQEVKEVTKILSTKNIEGKNEDKGVFVNNEKLDNFMKISGELIVLKNAYQLFCHDSEILKDTNKLFRKLDDISYALNKISDQLQEQIMDVRRVKLEQAFNKLPRIVRQVSQAVNKKVTLDILGGDLGVDKNIANVLSSCMTHLIRNAIDHGIETPYERRDIGKTQSGKILVTAKEQDGNIQLTIEDDGKGIDRNKVVKKAISKGIITEMKANALSDPEVFDFLFMPGFSTVEQVTDISGRGVGMDAVKSEILSLDGKVEIRSTPGQGTNIYIEIPVLKTVMVEKSIVAKADGIYVAVPINSVAQIIDREQLNTLNVNDLMTFQFGDKTVPLITHHSLIGQNPMNTLDGKQAAIVIRSTHYFIGLLVDLIEDQMEAVVRPFSELLDKIPGFKGTTVLGDDQIAFVVSPEEFIQIYLSKNETLAA